MNLIGYLTDAGADLESRIQAGLASLQITGVAAGTGPTAVSDSSLVGQHQTLSLVSATRSGTTHTVRARLVASAASEAYVLNELGVYAINRGANVLYRLYRLDEPVTIDPGTTFTADFSLHQTVLSGDQPEVVISPDTLLRRDEFDEAVRRHTVWNSVPQTIECLASTLQSTIDALPDVIDNDVTIKVTANGTTPGSISIKNKNGRGSIRITNSGSNAYTTVNGHLEAQHCHLQSVTLEKFIVKPTAPPAIPDALYGNSSARACVLVRCCDHVFLNDVAVRVTDPDTSTWYAYYAYRSDISIRDWEAKSCGIGVFSAEHAQVKIFRDKSNAGNGATGTRYLIWAGDDSEIHAGHTLATSYGETTKYYAKGGVWIHFKDDNYVAG